MKQDNLEAKPLDNIDNGSSILLIDSGAERNEYMRQLGAKNIIPSLPRSTHVRSKANGHVFPWEEIFAEQPLFFECCDAEGNTDPAAWESCVDHSDYDPVARDASILAVQEKAMVELMDHTNKMAGGYRIPEVRNPNSTPPNAKYPEGSVPYGEIEQLLAMLD